MPEGRRSMMKGLFFSILLMVFCTQAQAATQTLSACTEVAFTAAYNAASSGDTIAFPAGTCSLTLTTRHTIAKRNLTIQGAGTSHTKVTNNASSGCELAYTQGEQANGLRITGIYFDNTSQGTYFDNDGSNPGVGTKNYRVDHCYFHNSYYVLYTEAGTTGVIDHNTFDGSYILFYGSAKDADDSSPFPFAMGTSNANFVEDNTIINVCGQSHFVASNAGARYVLRYNTISDPSGCWDPVDVHGYGYSTNSNRRGSFTWEIYNNVFNIPESSGRLVHPRGGQGIMYNNVFRGNSGYEISLGDDQKCDQNPSCTWPCQDSINHTYFWSMKYNCGDLSSCDPHNIGSCCGSGSPITSGQVAGDGSCPAGIPTLNSDYFVTQAPSYTPYTYPHPLTLASTPPSDTTPPAAPKNFRIR